MPSSAVVSHPYRGRLAPSPTGLLHLGHARTFWIAAQRAAQHGGQLILRNEDLDPQRCKPEFVSAMFEDLHWLGMQGQADLAAAALAVRQLEAVQSARAAEGSQLRKPSSTAPGAGWSTFSSE